MTAMALHRHATTPRARVLAMTRATRTDLRKLAAVWKHLIAAGANGGIEWSHSHL